MGAGGKLAISHSQNGPQGIEGTVIQGLLPDVSYYIIDQGRGNAGLIQVSRHLVELRVLIFRRLHPQEDFIGIDGDGGQARTTYFSPENDPGADRRAGAAFLGNYLKIAQAVLDGNYQAPGGPGGI